VKDKSYQSNQKSVKYGVILPVELKKDLEFIANSEGHATLSSFVRSELIQLRDRKMKHLKEGDSDV
jgi:hypothetical protein